MKTKIKKLMNQTGQRRDYIEHQENKWYIMTAKIKFQKKKKLLHTNENELSRVRLCEKYGMNMEMNQSNWQRMNYNKKGKGEEKILKHKHIKLNLKKKTLLESKKRTDIGIWRKRE